MNYIIVTDTFRPSRHAYLRRSMENFGFYGCDIGAADRDSSQPMAGRLDQAKPEGECGVCLQPVTVERGYRTPIAGSDVRGEIRSSPLH